MLVLDEGGRRWTRADAFAEVAAALPLGRLWSWPLRLPGLRGLAGWGYDRFAANRTRISVWLGLAACGLPPAPGAAPLPAAAAAPTPVGGWLRRRLVPILRELGVAVTLVVLAAEVSVANAAIPPALRFERRPEWMTAAVQYTRLFQGWSLFSPDAPTSDEMVVVDAVTRDGRHVDPYNQAGSRVWALPVEKIPPRLGHDSFFCDYTLRIPDTHQYHQAFIEWVLRYPERTGHPKDEITSFDAYAVRQQSPLPGTHEPTDVRKELFLHWPAGGRP
jgi:hypothetical protein